MRVTFRENKCYSVLKKRQCIRVSGSGNRERDCALVAVKERATFEVLRGRVGKGRIRFTTGMLKIIALARSVCICVCVFLPFLGAVSNFKQHCFIVTLVLHISCQDNRALLSRVLTAIFQVII